MGLGIWHNEEEIQAYLAACPALADDPYTYETLRHLRAAHRAAQHVTWTVTSHECSLRPDCEECQKPRQTREEQAKIIDRAINYELWQETREAIHNA